MEVMSSLLLCVLVALLPQALGKQSVRTSSKDILFNNTIMITQAKAKHKLLLNLNGQPMVVKSNKLTSVYNDIYCSKCTNCMARAVQAYEYTKRKDGRDSLELHNDIISHVLKTHRDRRAATTTPADGDRKSKLKKSKAHKIVTVTKYNSNGKIHALKVKETFDDETSKSTCEVFSVANSYPCNSVEGDFILTNAKKSNKKSKREKAVPVSTTTLKTVVYKKREVDESQVPENLMLSFEDYF